MKYLITTAGKGSRFFKKGLKPFKPLVKVHGKELILWSLESFNFQKDDKVYIVFNSNDCNLEAFIKKKIHSFFKCEFIFVDIKTTTRGQLETAKIAIKELQLSGPVLIYNNDTYFNCEIQFDKYKDINGLIPVFINKKDNHFSFVKPIPNTNKCEFVTEKKRVSDLCSIGAYYFSNAELIVKFFNEYLNSIEDCSQELYIAPFYNFLIKNGFDIEFIDVGNKYKIFGTPKELCDSFNIRWNELLADNAIKGNHIGTLIIDIDDTICKTDKELDYEDRYPIDKMIEKIQFYHKKRYYIILNTSRNMNTYNGNIGLMNKYTLPKIQRWLEKYSVPYDEIYLGKPWGINAIYLDDKSVEISKFINNESI